MSDKQTFFHRNSIEATCTPEQLTLINRRRRKADVDLALKLRWARRGFVSLPGNLGPSDGEGLDD